MVTFTISAINGVEMEKLHNISSATVMMKKMLTKLMVLAMAMAAVTPFPAIAIDIPRVRQTASQNNVTCILVFGDSSVDPGNNNRLPTTFKGNFLPYGMNFLHGQPTGRFCNGKLPTDFIAEALGYTDYIPAFLDRTLTEANLLHGVSFASAASGYDDLTANLTNVLPLSKQINYLLHYKLKLRRLVGEGRADEIMKNAMYVLSMGSNDYIQNYFIEPVRSEQFTVEQYADFLVTSMMKDIKVMHRIGARRLVVVGVPPIGCMPLVKTLFDTKTCYTKFNDAVFLFNNKVKAKLGTLRTTLGVRSGFVDAYSIIKAAVENPAKFGFTESSKGCCGTGTMEYGDTCKGMPTCKHPSKYVFWDAVHPTEKMYQIIADDVLNSMTTGFFD